MLRTVGYTIAWIFILIAAAIGAVIAGAIAGAIAGTAGAPTWATWAVRIVAGLIGAIVAGGWLADGILPASPGRPADSPYINPHAPGTTGHEIHELRNDLRRRDET